MSGASLPAGFLTIEAPEPAEEQPEPGGTPGYYSRDDRRRIDYEASTFPERCATGTPQDLTAKPYGCSGSLDSTQYREATKFRDIPGMDWVDARVALNRLMAEVRENHRGRRRRRAQT